MSCNITVVMINSRSDKHPDWVQVAVESVKKQTYPCELIVINNLKRKQTIGQCWNRGVKEAKGDWILFVGDDDWLSREYVSTLVQYAESTKEDYAAFTTYMTAFDNETGEYAHVRRICTGMWKREYLLSHPFNEVLEKGVDREYIEEAMKDNQRYLIVGHHFGYFYRKHTDYSCAGKITFVKEPKELYVASSYNSFIEPIANRLKSLMSVYIGPGSLETEMADGAKVIWAEWANNHAVDIADYQCKAKKILRIHAYDAFGEPIKYLDFTKYDKIIFVAKHIKDYVESHSGILPNSVIIPNGVDVNHFDFENKVQNNKIAWAGILAQKKGLQLLLFIANHFPEYEFHVAGKFDSDDMAELFYKTKPDNVILSPYQYNIKEFFKDKTYILNTSPREGCPVTVLEGMACGLKPLIYNWVGAKDIYGDESVFSTIEDFRQLLGEEYVPESYRQEIITNFNFEDTYKQIETIVKELYV